MEDKPEVPLTTRFPFLHPWEWRGLVAFVLALGISVSLILTSLGGVEHLNSEETTLLSTVMGATIGALATYLGGSRRDRDPVEDHDNGEHPG